MAIIQEAHVCLSHCENTLYIWNLFITKAIIQNRLTNVSFCFILHYSSIIIRKKILLHESASAAWVYLAQA